MTEEELLLNVESWLVESWLPFGGTAIGLLILAYVVWSVVWKGLALWRAAQLGQKGWFIAILILNTLAILEILYLFVFSKKASKDDQGRQ